MLPAVRGRDVTFSQSRAVTLDKSEAWHFHRIIPSDMDLGSHLVEPLLDAMRANEWPEFEILRVQLAYEEAITNAIRHGNRHSPEKTVDVEFRCDPERVLVRIADQGEGFDPKNVPDPRSEDLLEVPGGRGVLMINELMTHVQYNSRGNELEMEKIRGAEEDLCDESE